MKKMLNVINFILNSNIELVFTFSIWYVSVDSTDVEYNTKIRHKGCELYEKKYCFFDDKAMESR